MFTTPFFNTPTFGGSCFAPSTMYPFAQGPMGCDPYCCTPYSGFNVPTGVPFGGIQNFGGVGGFPGSFTGQVGSPFAGNCVPGFSGSSMNCTPWGGSLGFTSPMSNPYACETPFGCTPFTGSVWGSQPFGGQFSTPWNCTPSFTGMPYSATPWNNVPFAGLNQGVTPWNSIPFAGLHQGVTPWSSIPFAGLNQGVTPWNNIPFAGLHQGVTPWNSISGITPWQGMPFASTLWNNLPYSMTPSNLYGINPAISCGIPGLGFAGYPCSTPVQNTQTQNGNVESSSNVQNGQQQPQAWNNAYIPMAGIPFGYGIPFTGQPWTGIPTQGPVNGQQVPTGFTASGVQKAA